MLSVHFIAPKLSKLSKPSTTLLRPFLLPLHLLPCSREGLHGLVGVLPRAIGPQFEVLNVDHIVVVVDLL